MTAFQCEVLHHYPHNKARLTRVTTPHGVFTTPVFMPVGTRAGVNNMIPDELREAGSSIILGGNTYHMLCAPGMAIIEKAGGMHPFMGWQGPMLTDSGGFQVFSLSKNKEICTIDEEGAHFRLPDDKRLIHMTPEMSLETQKIIGADIIMAFDQCTPDQSSRDEVRHIMTRTHRWLKQSIDYHQNHPTSRYGCRQALFGIIQGGIYEDLRCESADFVAGMDTDGIAIGGETVGFNMKMTIDIIRWVRDHLPPEKPRYTMGVGMSPQDLLDVVAQGVDMFDCVAPTRNARHGALYCGEVVRTGDWLKFDSPYDNHRISIKKTCFARDESPIMPGCLCYTCKNHTRAFLHQLSKQKANLFTALASIHNIHVMNDVCAKMRDLIISSINTQETK
ncbi:tRNA guanosine(34) transglycosylase Tgt [Legionella spiritensis]|uniref:Queuine tRNA-ribosyltransferase n=1 Tax=Legionella spiritensis TaxID=452 RepID=A0A0W0Z6A2_LEGSP|nr:tRNA guanosine(34) transglycosylase Tgt [Legionella spiritensis]KTD64355.1 queuine tRNA-ribosyltransferase [Legionella spiritensis]SNV46361.1 queuine tRNA-ribosyltransferase [Legionella spiritensis]